MNQIFASKKKSIIFVSAVLLIVILLCMLFSVLVQQSTINARISTFQQMISQYETERNNLEELLQYYNSDEFVRSWAEANGYVEGDKLIWEEEN